jgi:lipopolysaccharide biosynthesis regulator YciM
MDYLLWILLPIAAASGWWAAQRSQTKRKSAARSRFNSAYGQGLNYLLNEEPDKATEILIQLVEVDPDTVELHLALGSLFRRRGEVDRAIRVHQNIIARSALSDLLRNQATLELARDFLKAGLMDRAEQLLQALLDRRLYVTDVCCYLADLYQQEKEWNKAIAVASRISTADSAHWLPRIAHYHCELGELELGAANYAGAIVAAERALEADPQCARASVLLGSVYQHQGDFPAAVAAYQSIESQNRSLMPEVSAELENCYARLVSRGESRAQVSGVTCQASRQAGETDQYRCGDCGFTSKKLFWQCPGCQRWSSVKPVKLGKAE